MPRAACRLLLLLAALPSGQAFTCAGSVGVDFRCCDTSSCSGVGSGIPCSVCTSGAQCVAGSCTSTSCPAGKYLSGGACVFCLPGTANGAASTTASACPPCADGLVSPAGARACTAPCSLGAYALQAGGCATCGRGTYSAPGGLSCATCPAGTTSLAGSASAAACVPPCSGGAYLTASGCQACSANTYSAAGATACTPCRSYFQAPPGAAACAPPPGAAIMSSFAASYSDMRPAVFSDPVSLSAASPAVKVFSQAASAYSDRTSYYVTLEPPEGYAVLLTFLAVDSEECCDSVFVYTNASLTGELRATFSGALSGSSLPAPMQFPPGWSPSVQLHTDSSSVSGGVVLAASLVCADPACAAAPPQPSASPLPSASSTPPPPAPGGGGGGLGGSGGGGGGGGGPSGGASAAAGALHSSSAAGVGVGVVLVGLFVVAAGALIHRHSQAQLAGKQGAPGGSGEAAVVVSHNPMASALGGGSVQPRPPQGPRPGQWAGAPPPLAGAPPQGPPLRALGSAV